MSTTLDYASAFTGIGGFEVAFNALGMKPTVMIEKDPNCQTILRRHFNQVPLKGDIANVTGTDVGRPDIFVGGFPCNDTSIAAPHRAGLQGTRSANFFEFTRLIEEYQRLVDASNPRWVAIENPTGLLKSNGGRDFATVIRSLSELGYMGSWRVVNARSFRSPLGRSTPQQRGRVLILGHRGNDPRPARLVLGDQRPGGQAGRARQVGRGPHGSVPAPTAGAVVWRKSARPRAALSKGGYETWVSDGAANTLTGFDGGGPARQTHLIAQHGRLRTLTLREWERLQGFEDDWTDGIPPGDVRRDGKLIRAGRYTMIGNAIHTGTAHWFGARLQAVHNALPFIAPRP